MADMKTSYLGITLKNPIIVGASNLTLDNDNLKKIEDAGAAAIVYKSLFEEQIQLEKAQLEDDLDEYTDRHAEMVTLFPNIEHAGPQEYLHNLQKAREVVSIPFIASLNAVFKESWVEYAGLIEQTGVDGLELNFYNVPKDPDITGSAIEKQQLEILREVKKVVKIPVSVKLSFSYTSPLHFINELDKAGVDGVVLFNRFYQPDIDLGKLEHISEHNLSTSAENQIPMRFAGLLYSHLAAGICCSSGIHEGTDVIKMILSGADCVQVVSTIYMNKIHHITKMLNDIQNWMSQQGYKTLSDFKGRLARKNVQDPFVYQRAQYIDLLLKSGELFKKYTIR